MICCPPLLRILLYYYLSSVASLFWPVLASSTLLDAFLRTPAATALAFAERREKRMNVDMHRRHQVYESAPIGALK